MWKVPIGMRLNAQVKYGNHWEKFVKAQLYHPYVDIINIGMISLTKRNIIA